MITKSAWPFYPNKSARLNGRTFYAPHYFRWKSMMARCYHKSSPEYIRYGKRGIKVCKEWKDFWTFYFWCKETEAPGKTVDRINNDKGYSQKNCKWSTPSEQQKNSRVTLARRSGIKVAKIEQQKAHDKKWGNIITRKKKPCYFCKEVKSIALFNKNKTTSDGLQKFCRPCAKIIHKIWKIKGTLRNDTGKAYDIHTGTSALRES